MSIICKEHGRIAADKAIFAVELEDGETYYFIKVTATCPHCHLPMWTTYLNTQGRALAPAEVDFIRALDKG